jgi:hypothetical protein
LASHSLNSMLGPCNKAYEWWIGHIFVLILGWLRASFLYGWKYLAFEALSLILLNSKDYGRAVAIFT